MWYPTTGPAGGPVADALRVPLATGPADKAAAHCELGEAYLAIALARRGFVVASPTFPLTNTGTPGGPVLTDAANQPADIRFVIDQVLALSGGDGWLAGGVDRKRIGAQGLSLGGLTTLLVTYNPTLRDRRIRAAFAMAPASCELGRKTLAPTPPLLLIDGTQDLITPIDQNAGRTFMRGRMPRTLVTLTGATHTAFTGLIMADSSVNYDAAIGCSFVASITQQQVDDLIAAFGPAAAGTDTTGCDLPCRGPVPATAPMTASRQHDLTQAAGTAFFQERFQKSRAAHCFLRKVFPSENHEVTVDRRGGAAAPSAGSRHSRGRDLHGADPTTWLARSPAPGAAVCRVSSRNAARRSPAPPGSDDSPRTPGSGVPVGAKVRAAVRRRTSASRPSSRSPSTRRPA